MIYSILFLISGKNINEFIKGLNNLHYLFFGLLLYGIFPYVFILVNFTIKKCKCLIKEKSYMIPLLYSLLMCLEAVISSGTILINKIIK